MIHELRSALRLFLVLTVLTGVAYPLAVTLLAQGLFPARARGSLLRVDGVVRGSELVGQDFDDPRWFWGRPSATSPACNAALSGGSNLGPTHPALAAQVRQRAERLRATTDATRPIPIDLVTASASGLDPHISPAAARFQVARVAAARKLPEARVAELVESHVEGRTLGVLGEPRVNVLRLNLALQQVR